MTFWGISQRLWRPALGVLTAYAIAMQSLLIAIGAVTLPAQATDLSANGQVLSLYVICEHEAQSAPQDAPGLPTPGQLNFDHCVFCFAGTHVAVLASPPVFQLIGVTVRSADWSADTAPRLDLSAYAIARPRGPPAQV